MSVDGTNEARVRLWEQLAAQQQSATWLFYHLSANVQGCAELFEETLQRNKKLEDEVKDLRRDVCSASVVDHCGPLMGTNGCFNQVAAWKVAFTTTSEERDNAVRQAGELTRYLTDMRVGL